MSKKRSAHFSHSGWRSLLRLDDLEKGRRNLVTFGGAVLIDE